jgi:flagellum-specific peptidoglycan hydrolase FlgJ
MNSITTKQQAINNTSKFFDQIISGALVGGKQGILPSLTLAQAALESAFGARNINNNLFGIKASGSWQGPIVSKVSIEYINGVKKAIKSNFRAYRSFDESVRDHTNFLLATRYDRVRQAKTYQEACRAIYECGYATDPNYPNKLIKIIEVYSLMRYDHILVVDQENIDVLVDGIKAEFKAIIIDGKSYIPAINLQELIPSKVSWDGSKVLVSKENKGK